MTSVCSVVLSMAGSVANHSEIRQKLTVLLVPLSELLAIDCSDGGRSLSLVVHPLVNTTGFNGQLITPGHTQNVLSVGSILAL